MCSLHEEWGTSLDFIQIQPPPSLVISTSTSPTHSITFPPPHPVTHTFYIRPSLYPFTSRPHNIHVFSLCCPSSPPLPPSFVSSPPASSTLHPSPSSCFCLPSRLPSLPFPRLPSLHLSTAFALSHPTLASVGLTALRSPIGCSSGVQMSFRRGGRDSGRRGDAG